MVPPWVSRRIEVVHLKGLGGVTRQLMPGLHGGTAQSALAHNCRAGALTRSRARSHRTHQGVDGDLGALVGVDMALHVIGSRDAQAVKFERYLIGCE